MIPVVQYRAWLEIELYKKKKSRPHRSSSRNHYARTYPSAASALQKSSALRPVWEDENKTAITTSQEYPAWITRRPPGFQLIFLFRSAFYSTDVLVVAQLWLQTALFILKPVQTGSLRVLFNWFCICCHFTQRPGKNINFWAHVFEIWATISCFISVKADKTKH